MTTVRPAAPAVRPATPEDTPTLVDLLEECERHYGATEFDPWEQRAADVRAALFDQPPAAYALLAFADDRVAGLAAYSYHWPAAGPSRSLFLKELYVRDGHRGTGVGRALMRALFDIAAKTGCRRVEWNADTDNPVAQRFYRQLGVAPHEGKLLYRVTADRFADLLPE
jgi:GNAT superfamily N-acetyltransferase